MAFCAIDFETYYDDECSVKTLGPEAYVRHPDFAILGVAVKAPGVLFSGAPEDVPWEKLQGLDFVAHNARFDQTVYNFFKKNSGVSAAPENPVWRCTADMAVYLRAGRSLKEAAFDLLGVTMSKDPRTKAKGKRILPGHPDYDSYMRYCLEDTLVTYDLWDKFHDKWPEHEQEMSRLNRDQGALGISIDTETLTNDIANLQQLQLDAARSIPWDWDGKKTPLSIVQIGLWCRKNKIKPPTSLAENDERFLEWEEQNREQVPWVKPLRDWRKINVLLRKLETVRDRVDGDGIMSYETKYFGAHTGRFSGGGGFNIQNLPRIPSFGVNLRGLIQPRPGKVFIIADFAQIEARILLWFAGDEATLQMARDGVNIYESHARATMGWAGGVLKKENPPLYSLAKARCLGAGYGVGGSKFKSLAAIYGVELTEEEACRAISEYRASNPRVVSLWRTLERNFRWAYQASEPFEMELPSGRALVYEDITPLGNGLRARTTRSGNLTHFYGGKLTENLVQATAREVFVDRYLALAREGAVPLFHIHDEYVFEVPEQLAGEIMPAIVKKASENIPWLDGCPIEVEAEIADQYKK